MEAALETIVRDAAASCDMLVLPNLPADGPTMAAACKLARSQNLVAVRRPGHSSPFLRIATTWDAFIAGKDKKFRYKVRNSLKDLEGAGALTEGWIVAPAQVDAFYAQLLEIERNSWKVSAGMAICGSQMEQQYYRRLLPFLAARDALRANLLILDGRPIAYSLCYASGGAFRQLKTSFDDRYAELGPGSAVLNRSLQRAFESGATEFDFLGDVMQHKNQWASGVRAHCTVYLYLASWRGRLGAGVRRIADRLRRIEDAERPAHDVPATS